MKVTFIYPAISDGGFNSSRGPILYGQIHPGLCILSAVIKEEGFKNVSLIDLRMLSGWDDFKERVESESPDVACVTMMSPDFNHAKQCLDIIKEIRPGCRTIVGGMHPTVKTDDLLNEKTADHIIIGEAETILPGILRAIEKGKPVERAIRGSLADVDKLPFLDRELFDILEMPYDFFLELPFATILAGRGCSYNCKFCSPAGKIMHGYRSRRRSVDNVMKELTYLRDTYGIKSLRFLDDCFTEDPRWVEEFCKKYRENGFKLPFVCQTRADIICKNPGMMKELKMAGLAMVSIGFESGNDRILKFVNKGTTLKQNLASAAICKRLGIKIWAYHMFGMPGESVEESMDTVKMIKNINPYRSSAAFFTPLPGSYFYEYCRKEGLSLIGDHESFVRFPEIDKPKIKGIDYDAMRRMAVISKKPSLGVRARIRLERVIAHKKNKPFRLKFAGELAKNSAMNKMTVLRLAHEAGRI